MAELAKYRATTDGFEMEPIYVITRKELATANKAEWRIINESFNSVEGLISQSPVHTSDRELPRIRSVFKDMLSPDNMAGTEARKFVCPLFYINYMVSPR